MGKSSSPCMPLVCFLLPTKGRQSPGKVLFGHLGHFTPLCPQGGAGPSAQQKLHRGAVATLHSKVQRCLVEPASSIDLCTPVQEVADDFHMASSSSIVQGCEAQ
jgi:hypothetical protein